MNKTRAPIAEAGDSPPPVATARSYRPALVLAFFACFLWLLFVFSGWFKLPLSSELCVLIGLFVPLLTATAILYPSAIFRDGPPAFRMVMLFAFSFILLVLALGLWAVFSLLLIAVVGISPE